MASSDRVSWCVYKAAADAAYQWIVCYVARKISIVYATSVATIVAYISTILSNLYISVYFLSNIVKFLNWNFITQEHG
jgi:hypothetical protein